MFIHLLYFLAFIVAHYIHSSTFLYIYSSLWQPVIRFISWLVSNSQILKQKIQDKEKEHCKTNTFAPKMTLENKSKKVDAKILGSCENCMLFAFCSPKKLLFMNIEIIQDIIKFSVFFVPHFLCLTFMSQTNFFRCA